VKQLKRVSALFAVLALLQGCSGPMVKIAATPPEGFASLGKVEGKACGMHGIVSTAYYFVPMGLNGRTQKAYNAALAKAPGATGLIDVTVSEDWAWVLLGTMRCVTVTGTAVK